jgi:hypothetical protein
MVFGCVSVCARPPLGVGAGLPSGGGGGTEAAGGATPGWDERESVLSIRAERTHSHVSRRAPACDSYCTYCSLLSKIGRPHLSTREQQFCTIDSDRVMDDLSDGCLPDQHAMDHSDEHAMQPSYTRNMMQPQRHSEYPHAEIKTQPLSPALGAFSAPWRK